MPLMEKYGSESWTWVTRNNIRTELAEGRNART
jgi:hypothetical protein